MTGAVRDPLGGLTGLFTELGSRAVQGAMGLRFAADPMSAFRKAEAASEPASGAALKLVDRIDYRAWLVRNDGRVAVFIDDLSKKTPRIALTAKVADLEFRRAPLADSKGYDSLTFKDSASGKEVKTFASSKLAGDTALTDFLKR